MMTVVVWAALENLSVLLFFGVSWMDDHGTIQVDTCYRIQHSMAIGPCQPSGLRFQYGANLSILEFLAFEQTFKNALATLPIGGGKGAVLIHELCTTTPLCFDLCLASQPLQPLSKLGFLTEMGGAASQSLFPS